MRIRYGNIYRYGDRFLAQRSTDTCIDCGWAIKIGDLIRRAEWVDREISGFYAHNKCQPIDSDWVTNIDFPTIIGRGKFDTQRCRPHGNLVTARALVNDFIRYVCPKCEEDNTIT